MFFKKNPEKIKVSLFNYPDVETMRAIIRSTDEANTDPNTTIEIICTLTRETLAERRSGNWEIFWCAEGTLANTLCALAQFKMA
jgi:hypothetical protein